MWDPRLSELPSNVVWTSFGGPFSPTSPQLSHVVRARWRTCLRNGPGPPVPGPQRRQPAANELGCPRVRRTSPPHDRRVPRPDAQAICVRLLASASPPARRRSSTDTDAPPRRLSPHRCGALVRTGRRHAHSHRRSRRVPSSRPHQGCRTRTGPGSRADRPSLRGSSRSRATCPGGSSPTQGSGRPLQGERQALRPPRRTQIAGTRHEAPLRNLRR